MTAPAGMSDEDAKAVKDYWDANFTGTNRGRIGVIGADMKFTPFAFKAIDSQMVEQLRYSEEHEWVAGLGGEDGIVTVGITAHAADALGEIVYLELQPSEGDAVEAGEPCGEIESTKSVSDLYSPVSGEVVEANQDVVDDPSLVNSAPFEGGWLFKVRVSEEAGDLLTADEYSAFIGD